MTNAAPICLLLAGTMLAGCSSPNDDVVDTHETRAAQIATIAKQCHLPASTFRLVGMEELHFDPPVDVKYETVDCALGGVRKLPFPVTLAITGHEQDQGNTQ